MKLLIIDPQNDFCMPGASLFIKGADADMHRLSNFIISNVDKIESIDISLDMHMYDDIAHPMYWIDKEGKNPIPFTNITIEDVENGTWNPSKSSDLSKVKKYLLNLKNNNKFTHTIWPYHCIAGTFGANIFPPLLTAIKHWMDISKKSFYTHIKGMDRNSEHFGIFQAEDRENSFNHNLCDKLFQNNSNVLVAGQAKSHCVATSLNQILETRPYNVKNITLLTDTTSNVEGCEHIAEKIYENLHSAGMQELTTEEIFVTN